MSALTPRDFAEAAGFLANWHRPLLVSHTNPDGDALGSLIAMRSLLYVDGYGFAWAGDVGGAIKGKRIDLCYNTTEEALRWGRRKAKVYVLGRRPLSYYAKKKKR